MPNLNLCASCTPQYPCLCLLQIIIRSGVTEAEIDAEVVAMLQDAESVLESDEGVNSVLLAATQVNACLPFWQPAAFCPCGTLLLSALVARCCLLPWRTSLAQSPCSVFAGVPFGWHSCVTLTFWPRAVQMSAQGPTPTAHSPPGGPASMSTRLLPQYVPQIMHPAPSFSSFYTALGSSIKCSRSGCLHVSA